MQHSKRPEYTYNYHWGRILFATALLVGLGIGTYQLIFSNNEEPTTTQPSIAQERTKYAEPTREIEIAALEAEEVEVSEEIATAETPQIQKVPEIQSNETPTPKKEATEVNAVALEPKAVTKKDATEETASEIIARTEIKVERTSTKSSDTRTKAELFTAAIKRAKLTAQVKRREPGDSLPQDLALDPKGLSKVYFYTEVIGQAGKTHYHHWYRNGKLQAKVPITIGSDRWRCYSSKYLTHQQTGEWSVKVKDAQGKLLAQSDFNFINQ